ncbi:MAG: division/cell wall cluster transcriptional repressor MraZ [Acidimicrobiia bacterium]|nr:division/cell wall cluster transcriptional repressor MraZ [Acidimicrobiia bacterium]
MFLGTYEHTLDAKGRLVMPRKFRAKLEDGCYVTPGQEGCLTVWTPDAFQREYQRVTNLPSTDRDGRLYRRTFLGAGTEVTPDKQGRVPISEALRQWAQLEKDVTVLGQGEVVEVWATEVWAGEKEISGEYFQNIEDPIGTGGEEL